jgi:hypothetical protein
MPRFEEGVPDFGFDITATPPWLMVGLGDSKVVFLLDGAGMVATSQNANIASVQNHIPNTINNFRRLLAIGGHTPGVTRIDVFSPGVFALAAFVPRWRQPDLSLAVTVKAPRTVAIAFQYVTDDLLDETTRTRAPQFLDDLLNALNATFPKQANVTFTKARAAPVQVKTSLFKIVSEQPDVADLRDRGELSKLALAGDPDAEINVFFMPWPWTKKQRASQTVGKDGKPLSPDQLDRRQLVDKRPSQMIGTARACICEDEMSDGQVMTALHHMVGRCLGCPVTYSEKKKHYLMHSSRAEGNPGGSMNGGFIPKDCSDTMNLGY